MQARYNLRSRLDTFNPFGRQFAIMIADGRGHILGFAVSKKIKSHCFPSALISISLENNTKPKTFQGV
jgi:hypothetical protein